MYYRVVWEFSRYFCSRALCSGQAARSLLTISTLQVVYNVQCRALHKFLQILISFNDHCRSGRRIKRIAKSGVKKRPRRSARQRRPLLSWQPRRPRSELLPPSTEPLGLLLLGLMRTLGAKRKTAGRCVLDLHFNGTIVTGDCTCYVWSSHCCDVRQLNKSVSFIFQLLISVGCVAIADCGLHSQL